MLAMSSKEMSAYTLDGYVIRKDLLSSKEVALFRDSIRVPIEAEIKAGTLLAKKDREGKTGLVKPLTKADAERYGFLGRDERLVHLAQDAVGKPIYPYVDEISVKQPNIGGDGGWDWHQDFAAFHANGLLAPQLATIWLPLETATTDNGCMRVLKGSHKLGRLNHNYDLVANRIEFKRVNQSHVEQKALDAAMKRFEAVYIELEPGDAMVFDGNLIHRSGPNRSNTQLWSYICYYNAVENGHYKEDHEYGHCEPLKKV
ncbi:phytanoyl-CoA dioxygenase family protein [Bradyrhizobium retamae]|uniref:Phytanoyl-CoA dioxygenase n=1 Tax=Bradyrhizobium retamae TaxID=1300035 RepID=A0A0R3NHX8_9BRAD|nr:phytanoyl-CoA dioxygenase family protein [Bradyrhizobium retamae]KRR29616.1 phytanoyl-CoA dioxygenase [Bradyrhizobium retamae]